MNDARILAQKAVSSSIKADHKTTCEIYRQAIEKAKDCEKSTEVAGWYRNCGSSMYWLQDYQAYKALGFEYLKYAQTLEDWNHIKEAYDIIVNALENIEDADKQELEKYRHLGNEAQQKYMEVAAMEAELMNPVLNSEKVKAVFRTADLDKKITKQFTEKDLEEAVLVDAIKILQNPNFLKKMEESAKKLVWANEVIRVKQPISVKEAVSYGNLGFFANMAASMGTKDPEIVDFLVKAYDKGITILESIDPLSNELSGMLSTASAILNTYPDRADLAEKWKKNAEKIAERINQMAKEKETAMNEKIHDLEEAKDQISERVAQIEAEHKQLGEKYESLRKNVDLIQEKVLRTNEKLNEVAKKKEDIEDGEFLNSLLGREKVLLQRKALLKRIGQNHDLSDYYNGLMQELEAIYIGARSVQSGKVGASKSSSFQSAADFANSFIEMIPIIGGILNNVISGVAALGDAFTNAKSTRNLENICEISANIAIYSEFCEVLALLFVKKNEVEITKLQGEQIHESKWKKMIKSAIDGGAEGVFTTLLKENDSKAKLQGKADAIGIIGYLQSGKVKIKPGDECEEIAEKVFSDINAKDQQKNDSENHGANNQKEKKNCSNFCRLV